MVVSAMLFIGSSSYAETLVSSNTTSAIDDDTVTVNGGKSVTVSETQSSESIDIYAIRSRGTANINNDGTLTVTSTITAGNTGSYSVATGIVLDGTSGSAVNNGNINVTSTANATVINAGNVDATGIGISTNANIVNNGQMTVRGSGFTSGIGSDAANTTATTIVNNGTIDVASTNGGTCAIDLDLPDGTTMSGNSSVTNNGTLKSRGVAFADGIAVGAMQDHASIVNGVNGVIDLAATNLSEDSVGVGANSMSNYASITNNGTITKADQGPHDALGMGTVEMHDYASITNNRTLNVSNTTGNAIGVGVLSGMDGHSSIINTGTINTYSRDTTSMGVLIETHNAMSDNAIIQNSGSINASSDEEKAFGIMVVIPEDDSNRDNGVALGGSASIINTGSINVNTNSNNIINASDSDVSVGIDTNNMRDNAYIQNSGTITATINNQLDAHGLSVVSTMDTDSTVVFSNTASGKLYGNIYIRGDATFNNAGLVSLPYNANTTSGEFQPYIPHLTNTGTLEIGAKKTSGSIENSQLLTNTATFDTGSKIHVNVVAGSQPLVSGERLSDVVTARTSLTVNDLSVDGRVADTSALLNFTYEINKNNSNQDTIDLIATQAQTIVDAVTDNDSTNPPVNNGDNTTTNDTISTSRGNQNVINAAEALMTAENFSSMGGAISTLQSLSTNQEVARAVESATPSATAAIIDVLPQLSRGLSNIVTQRQNANMVRGFNAGDEVPLDKNLWVKPFGSYGVQQTKDGINGFNVKSYGIGMGFDGEYRDGQNIGLALFYSNADIDIDNTVQKSDLNIYSAIIYGSNLFMDNRTNLSYQMGYSAQKTSLERQVFTGDKAKADYTSEIFSADLRLGREYKVSDSLVIEPKIGTTYRYYVNPSYKEKGAGALNLDVDRMTSSEWIGSLGMTAYYGINDTFKMIMGFSAGYDFRDDERTITSSFEGANGITFDTNGIDNGRWNYDATLALEGMINQYNSINLLYSYQGKGEDFSNHTIAAKYMHKF